jgi:hypothetical protein
MVVFVFPLMAQIENIDTASAGSTVNTPVTKSPLPVKPMPSAFVLPEKDAPGKILFRWSLAALAAGDAADGISSWRRPEINPALAAPGADFGGRSLAVKSALLGGSLLIERYAIHKNPRARRPFAWMNFALAAGFGAVAIHNFRLH